MAFSKREKVHGIVHTTALSCGGIGAGLAQLPTSDNVPITALQIAMVKAIALVHGRTLSDAMAAGMLGSFTAGLFGRALSQWLVGWIPAWGNSINAATAASLTEAVGWASHAYFEQLGNEPLLSASVRPASVRPLRSPRKLLGKTRYLWPDNHLPD